MEGKTYIFRCLVIVVSLLEEGVEVELNVLPEIFDLLELFVKVDQDLVFLGGPCLLHLEVDIFSDFSNIVLFLAKLFNFSSI